MCRYTFENRCNQNPRRKLEDESVKVFINPYGKDIHISQKLQDLLEYLQGKESKSLFVQKIKKEVEKAKNHEEWKVEYMTLLMRDQENIEKGIERGRIEGHREGIAEGRHQIIVNMLKKQIPVEQIAELYSATIEEVEKVLKTLETE